MSIIIPDHLGDWRIETVGKVRGDQVLPGGQLAKDGTLFWKTTITRDHLFGPVGFPTPQPIALTLDIALMSAINARQARKSVVYPRLSEGGAKTAEADQAPFLYEYIEHCMVAAVFAFQSIELFANHSIWTMVKGPLTIRRKNKNSRLTVEQLERSLSTDNKILQVFPQIYKKDIDTSSNLWTRYEKLKQVRDSVVHLKSKDHYVRNRVDEDSVYFRCLNMDPIDFPKTCIALMRHFINRTEIRWLDVAEDYLKAAETS